MLVEGRRTRTRGSTSCSQVKKEELSDDSKFVMMKGEKKEEVLLFYFISFLAKLKGQEKLIYKIRGWEL